MDGEISPRTKLTSVPFSFRSALSDSADHSRDKTIDAGELVSGRLDTARYSAYEDLLSEGSVGSGSNQVAAGDHIHSSGSFRVLEDTTSVAMTICVADGLTMLKSLTIPAGDLGHYLQLLLQMEIESNTGSMALFLKINDSLKIIKGLGGSDTGNVILDFAGMPASQPNNWIVVQRRDIFVANTGNNASSFPLFGINPSNDVVISLWINPLGGCVTIIMNELIILYDGH